MNPTHTTRHVTMLDDSSLSLNRYFTLYSLVLLLLLRFLGRFVLPLRPNIAPHPFTYFHRNDFLQLPFLFSFVLLSVLLLCLFGVSIASDFGVYMNTSPRSRITLQLQLRTTAFISGITTK